MTAHSCLRHLGCLLVLLAPPEPALPAEPLAFAGAAGFGARARGGTGGPVIEVTRLDDDSKNPPQGSFRWAVQQKGPRIVTFRVSGNIRLERAVKISEPFLTIDGMSAPGAGVCLQGGSLEFHDTHDLIVRGIRVRLGDETTRRANRERGLKRPESSEGLDCIELQRCHDAIIDHVSASWSCDELFSVVHCENVTVQWCLLAEPLANPELHPYGNNHAFCFNASASSLSIHHCLFAHYVMRGPQFEANDMRKGDPYAVRMEAIGNVMFDYHHSGSRYTAGIEDHRNEAAERGYAFQFIANHYLGKPELPAIEGVLKHGVHDGVAVFADRPERIQFSDREGREPAMEAARRQIRDQPLFAAEVAVTAGSPSTVLEQVLAQAGCSHVRDAVDLRIVSDVRSGATEAVIRSQTDVGGWPALP